MIASGSALSVFRLFLVGCLAGASPCVASDLATDAKSWSAQHTATFEKASQLSRAGDVAAGNQLLIDLAEKDGGPIAAFMVANTLYGWDPTASYRLHLRAQTAFPTEPAVALEMAMEQHRQGEYAEAIVNYRRFLDAGKDPQYSALLADCLVRTGQLQAAVQAWDQANHRQNQTAIDSAICAIYGPLVPGQRRGDLIAKIRAGDFAKLNDLILLDLNFDTDWWNSAVASEELDRDLRLAAKLLGEETARYQQLALYTQLAQPVEKKPVDIRRALTSAGLILGPEAALPADSKLARAFSELVVTNRVATAADLWASHQAALRARVAETDHEALHLLCWLASATRNNELVELDRLGWEEWNDPTFAAAYAIDLYREKKLTSADDFQLRAAMAASRDDTRLNQLRIALAGEEAVTKEMLVSAIKAEYHKLSVGTGIRDSSTLNGLYFELGKRL